MRGTYFPPLEQELEPEHRARESHQPADQDRRAPAGEPERERGGRQQGEAHLERAPEERLAPELDEGRQRELDAEREEEKDHADLGEPLDLSHVGDEGEAVRAEHHPRCQKPHDRRQAQALEDQDNGQREEQQDNEIAQKREIGHGSVTGRGLTFTPLRPDPPPPQWGGGTPAQGTRPSCLDPPSGSMSWTLSCRGFPRPDLAIPLLTFLHTLPSRHDSRRGSPMGDERWGIVLAGGEGDRMSRPPLPAISGGRPLAMITTGLPAVEPTGLEECSVEA